MTLDEAIRLLNLDIESASSTPPADLDKAEQLGIEALERVKASRVQRLADFTEPLPGETEE